MSQHYLVIDQGGHGTRALVFDAVGNPVVATHAPVITTNPKPGWFEQEADDLVASIKTCLEQLGPILQEKQLLISSAALITQRSSLVACYKDSLKPMTPIISWQDTRNSVWLQKQIDNNVFNINELKKLTGLRLNAHYGASKMRWLLDNHTEVKKAQAKNNLVFLPLAAFVTHLLTNSNIVLVDAATASRTFLTEFGKLDWSPTLLDLFSIDQHTLPSIAASKADFGNIMIGHQVVPLQVVGGDQSFLPFAYGQNTLRDALFVNAGTGAFVQTPLNQQQTPSQLLCSLAAIDQQQQLTVAEGTVNACASALDWLFEDEKQSLTHAEIEQAMQTFLSPPIFYHRVAALGSPYWLPVGTSTFSENTSLTEKTVAVIESIIFLLAINIDLLQHAKPNLKRILISGGISNADSFCQKLATTTRLSVIRCADHEASSRGAAFYLGNITHYPALKTATVFLPRIDNTLLARYQHFYEWLRNEWMKNQ